MVDSPLHSKGDVVLQTVETMSPHIFTEVASGDYRVSVDRSIVSFGLCSTDDINDAGFDGARLTVAAASPDHA